MLPKDLLNAPDAIENMPHMLEWLWNQFEAVSRAKHPALTDTAAVMAGTSSGSFMRFAVAKLREVRPTSVFTLEANVGCALGDIGATKLAVFPLSSPATGGRARAITAIGAHNAGSDNTGSNEVRIT